MTKKEIHDALKSDGAKIKAVNFYSLEQLESLYAERFGDVNQPESTDNGPKSDDIDVTAEESPKIHTLMLDHSGWCNELNCSYFQGLYRPVSISEYSILRKYAQKEI